MSDDDLMQLIEDDPPAPAEPARRPYKVVVIDDDASVHNGTKFALYDYALHGRGLEILSAFSGEEGRRLLAAHPDTAVVLLDVVMETDDAGLDLVDYIRNDLGNEAVRIILRTGQPGQAPERRIIVDYDINDYKAKTELTADKLFTALTAALRSYDQLSRMAKTRRGLELIVEAAAALFDVRSLQRLAEGVLMQLGSLLEVPCDGILVLRSQTPPGHDFAVLAGSGCYARFVGCAGTAALDPPLADAVEGAFAAGRNLFVHDRSVLFMRTTSGREVVVILEAERPLSPTDRTLVEVFCSRLSAAFDTVILYEELQAANATLEARVEERTRELKSANERLARQWNRLRRSNAFKNEILGTVAHDLKNPLGVILGRSEMMTEFLKHDPVPKDRLAQQIDHIHRSTERLTDMVNALISDAMTDAHDIVLRTEPIDLALIVREVVEANRPLATRKTQRFVVDTPSSVPAHGDSDRLREAIDNLVSNAIKYSPQGASIAVRVGRTVGEAVVEVEDRGQGLAPEDLQRLFGRFQRLSARPTGGETSTGLGLSIAKRIIDLHGGRIGADSEGPGQGATFFIALPLSPAAEGATP